MLAVMRTYGQYCPAAKALEVVGDRWTLLIVRELLLRGGSRYTDLEAGLPGIATNLLAERLRDLEAEGIVRREQAPPPIATTLYHLTPRGQALRPVVKALGAWGSAYLPQAPDTDTFYGYWLTFPAETLLRDTTPGGPAVTIELRAPDGSVTVHAGDGETRAEPGVPTDPDVVVSGPHRTIMRLMAGRADAGEAARHGLTIHGDPAVLERFLPAPGTWATMTGTPGAPKPTAT
jgi:DNA-binding HxlR family transcriptional regulator